MAVFYWSRRKQKTEQMVRADSSCRDLYEFPAAERPQQDALLEHVLQATPLRVRARTSCIPHGIEAGRAEERVLETEDSLPYRFSSGGECDLQGEIIITPPNYVLQTSLALCLFCHITPLPMWIGTDENPSDDPTRGRRLRDSLVMSDRARREVERIAEQNRWAFLVTKAQWAARRSTWDASLGFPGEGPQRREIPLENKGQDLRVRVSAVTMRRYAERIADFQEWLNQHDLGEVKDLADDPAMLNAALTPYLQGLYNDQKPVSYGSFLLAGLQLYYPQTINRMQPSWQIQKQWNQLAPSETRVPTPVEVLLALAVVAWVTGLQRTSTALLLGFHLLLRPAEIGNAKRRHLTLPSDTSGALDSGVFAIMKPKTARTTLLQSVVIEDPKLLLLAEGIFGADHPDSLWIRGGLARLQANFHSLKRKLSIQTSPYTLGSLRAGGAVEYLRRTSNSAGLQIRGRWVSQRSMFHYTQLSLAAVSVHSIQKETREKLFAFARMASTLLDPRQWTREARVEEVNDDKMMVGEASASTTDELHVTLARLQKCAVTAQAEHGKHIYCSDCRRR
eukprot:4185404-Amphidinium_carterae.2